MVNLFPNNFFLFYNRGDVPIYRFILGLLGDRLSVSELSLSDD